MKVIQHPLKEFCDSLFPDPNESDAVYKFYKFLKATQDSSQSKLMSATERKKKSLEYLVTTFGKELVLECIKELQRQYDAGELQSNTLIYFNRFVSKYAQNRRYAQRKDLSLKIQPLVTKPVVASITPIKSRKITDEFEGDFEPCNWLYQCSNCQAEFDSWTDTCPSCKHPISWEGILT